MNKPRKSRLAVLLLSLILIFGLSAQATIAYLTTETQTITNTFKPVQTSDFNFNIEVTGSKDIKNRDWNENDNFKFILQMKQDDPATEEIEWTQVGTTDITEDVEFDFTGQIKQQLTSAGTYEFQISEVKGDDKDLTYDETVFGFIVKVQSENGVLSIASVEKAKTDQTIAADAFKVDYADEVYNVAVVFTNVYTEPTTDPEQPSTGPTEPGPTDPTGPSETDPTDPSTPSDDGDKPSGGKDDASQTGDDFNLVPLLLLMLAGAAVAVLAVTVRREKTE